MSVITFDATFYLAQNPDVAAAVAAGTIPSAQFHFEQFGQFELRDPNEFFDSDYYLTTNTDVLAAVQRGEFTSGFQHFLLNGQAEGVGRSPNASFEGFNEASYLAANPDVAAAVAAGSFANGFQHFVQFGVNEPRPGTGLDESSQLATQLEALADAEVAVDDSLEDSAAALNAEGYLAADGSFQAVAGEPLEGAALAAAIAAFEETDFADAVAGVATLLATERGDLAAASLALQTARDADSDAELAAAVVDTRADVLADTAGAELLEDLESAQAALDRDLTADGSNEAIVTDLGAAIGAFIGSGGALTTDILRAGGAIGTVGDLLDAINTALAEDDAVAREAAFDAIVDTFGGAGSLTLETGTGGSAASRTALTTELGVVEQRGDLEDAVTAAEDAIDAAIVDPATDPDTAAALTAYLAALEDVSDSEDLIDAEAEAQADLAVALELTAALRETEGTIEARDDLIEAIEETFGPINVLDGVDDDADVGDDVFVFEVGSDVTTTVGAFGDDGDDVIFVGRGFTEVELEDDFAFGTTAAGSVNALEIFIQNDGAGNTVIFIEDETFDGSTTTGAFGGSTITLTGVAAEDVTLDANGFLRLAPEADALVA